MAMTINTNVVSLNAQRNLSLSGNSLSTTMQRLSSGLRVNSAKDDAAGLAISERMNAQTKGLAVAARNANDGISLAQTAEGALGKVGDMLQRARELAVQSSNATNSADDRKALQAEVSQLMAEVDRVAKTTSFNGKNLLDGSFNGAVFQVGANSGDNISVGAMQNTKVDALASVEYGASTSSVVKSSEVTEYGTAIEKGTLKLRVGAEVTDLGEIAKANSGQERMGQVVAAINAKTADTGVTAFLSGDDKAGFKLELRSASGDAVALEGVSKATTGFGGSVDTDAIDADAMLKAADAIKDAYGAAVTGFENLAKDTAKGAEFTAAFLKAADGSYDATAATGGKLLADFAGALTNEQAKADFVAAVEVFKGKIEGAAEFVSGTTGDKEIKDAKVGDLKADLATLKTAFDNAVKAEAASMVEAQRTAIASDVSSGLDDIMKMSASELKADLDNQTDGKLKSLSENLAKVGVTLDTSSIKADMKPEDLAAAQNSILSQVDTAMTGGLGISTIAGADGKAEAQVQTGLDTLSVETQAGAWEAIQKLDSAINQVNAARGDLGALQTRFEKTVENIDIQSENITAARGRIVDADFATETANLSRSQILQQAGTAMVAQANQLPQNVLSLLR